MNLFYRLSQLVKAYRKSTTWRKIFSVTACVVVFVTTYALILPALTLETELKCSMEEHAHTSECVVATRELICEEAEHSGHAHTADCYKTTSHLVCGLAESEATDDHAGHQHSDSCYADEQTLICSETEGSGHTHSDSCYTTVEEIICGKEQHQHTGECYASPESDAETELSDEDLIEGDDDTTDGVIQGDPEADVESREQWEATMKKVELTGIWADDLLAIARSQEGYRESTRNYMLNEEGKKKGYSRYGAWYGMPYADWCAMYVSFCLNYAEIPRESVPYSAECSSWISKLTEKELFHANDSDYEPQPGDLIFFNFRNKKASDHVGIVTGYDKEESKVHTIEGNSGNQVRVREYAKDDKHIVGYGQLPKNPEMEELFNTEFTYQDEELVVTATLPEEAPMPEAASFEVVKLEEGSEEYEANQELLASYAEEQGVVVLESILYDMHFQQEGEEVEPEAAVNVKVEFLDAARMFGELKEGEEIRILHMNEQTKEVVVEDVTEEIVLNDESQVTEATFVTESFSQVVITKQSKAVDQMQPGELNVTYESVLGPAVNYGIVANKIVLTNHMDTTFAVKNLVVPDNRDVTAGKYVNCPEDPTFAGYYWISRITGNQKFKYTTDSGKKANAYIGENALAGFQKDQFRNQDYSQGSEAGEIIIDTEANIDAYIDSVEKYVHQQGEAMAGQTTYTPISPTGDRTYYGNGAGENPHPIDLTSLPGGTYYIDGDYFWGQDNGQSVILPQFKINNDQTIVFNFDNENIDLEQFVIYIGGERYDSGYDTLHEEPIAQHVIFNCPKCTSLKINNTCGTVIAPHAKTPTDPKQLNGSCGGWLVVDELNGNNGEWHHIWTKLPKELKPIEATAKIEAKKFVNGKTPTDEQIFDFEIRKASKQGNEIVAITGSDALLPGVQNEGGSITFLEITCPSAEFDDKENHTYYYQISEVTDNVPDGWSYDEKTYYVRVDTTPTPSIDITYVNKYDEELADKSPVDLSDEVPRFDNKEVVDIQVDKKWFEIDGQTPLDPAIGEIKFKLMQVGTPVNTDPVYNYVKLTVQEVAHNYYNNAELSNPTRGNDGKYYPNPRVWQTNTDKVKAGSTVTITFKVNKDWESGSEANHYILVNGKKDGNNFSCATGSWKPYTAVEIKRTYTINSDTTISINTYDNWWRIDNWNVAVDESTAQPISGSTTTAQPKEEQYENPASADGLYTVSAPNWSTTITGLPKADDQYTYTYKVTEVNVPDYTTSYDPSDGSPDDSGKVTIKNTSKYAPFELPETGGPGIKTIRMLGSVMIFIAAGLMIFKKRRKEGI